MQICRRRRQTETWSKGEILFRSFDLGIKEGLSPTTGEGEWGGDQITRVKRVDFVVVYGLYSSYTAPLCSYLQYLTSLIEDDFSHHPFSFQRVKDEVVKRKMQYSCCLDGQDDGLKFEKPLGHDQFHASLAAAKLATACSIRECQQDLHNSPTTVEQDIHQQCTGQHKPLTTSVLEEPI